MTKLILPLKAQQYHQVEFLPISEHTDQVVFSLNPKMSKEADRDIEVFV